MDQSIYVTPPMLRLPDPPPPGDVPDLLRALLEVQRDTLAVLRQQQMQNDGTARWRAFLARWQEDFPGIGQQCKQVLPVVERAYLTLMQDLTDRLLDADAEPLDNEFVLNEFLDRYGPRLNQLGTVLGQLSPLADAAPAEASS
jgi:hypothetical protein